MSEHADVLDAVVERRLRRGLGLLAAEAADTAPAARRAPRWLPASAIATAAAVVAVAIGVGTPLGSGGEGSTPVTGERPPAAVGAPPGGEVPGRIRYGLAYDLPRLVAESPRIAIGTVVEIRRGALPDDGGLDYLIGIVNVEEILRGPQTEQIAAFDYDYGRAVVAGSARGANLVEGARVLLFLADSAGTVHEAVEPAHWQVTGGAQGVYAMRGAEPDAPFTLEEIRREIARLRG